MAASKESVVTGPAASASGGALDYYRLSVEDCVASLQSDSRYGLSGSDVERRRAQYGSNVLSEAEHPPVWRAFLFQFQDFMQLLLLGACVASTLIDQYATAITLLILALLNAVLGMWQESRAEASVAALKQMLQIHSRVIRDGQTVSVEAEELVPGDVFLIE